MARRLSRAPSRSPSLKPAASHRPLQAATNPDSSGDLTHLSSDEHDEQREYPRRTRLALSTVHAHSEPEQDSASDSSVAQHPVKDRRQSYSSVIHFERPKSIRLHPLDKAHSSSSGLTHARTTLQDSHARAHEEAARAKDETRRPIHFRLIFVALMLLATVTSLDNVTVYQYVSYATSSFAEHSALGIIQTAQAILIAVSRPVVSKESLLIGLASSYLLAVAFYTSGYIVIAASPSIAVYAVGTMVSQLGNSALVSLQSTAIFQYTSSLGNNALLNSLLTTPYYLTGWIASFIVEGVLTRASWRWGYGMFCIMTPALILPLLVLLFVDERRKKRVHRASAADPPLPPPSPTRSVSSTTVPLAVPSPSRSAALRGRMRALVGEETHAGRLDAVGVVLLGVALAGLLLPLTLVSKGTTALASPSTIAPLAAGGVALLLLILHEPRAACPLFPLEVFRLRRTVVCLAATGLNMTSFFLLLCFQYSFIQVMYPTWSPLLQGFFAFSEHFTLMFAHLVVALPVRRLVAHQTALRTRGELFVPTGKGWWTLRAPMWWTVGGHGVRVLGVGLMILSRGVDGPVWLLVTSQVIHGAGGAVAGVFCTQVALAAIPTAEGATMVWGLLLLVGDVGNAVGTALATLMWQHFLPLTLVSHLSGILSPAELSSIFDSTAHARSYPPDSAASLGIRAAYAEVMRLLLRRAVVVALAGKYARERG